MPETSLSPIRDAAFGFDQARHLLNRAGFGGTPRQVQALQQMGLEAAVAALVDYDDTPAGPDARPDFDPDIMKPLTDAQRQAYRAARKNEDEAALDKFREMRLQQRRADRQQMAELGRWWIGRMIATPRPLEEKLTLLWHNHFASSYRGVNDSWLMYRQNALLRQHAKGHFGNLAMGIVHDPAMLRYLNNNQNRKGRPNENLARELMELFTLGEGNYTERDIREGARALTGYTYHDNEFVFRENQHDDGEKTILGQTGHFDGDGFVKVLLRQKACARFVASKLYDHFVADVSAGESPEHTQVINQLARQLWREEYRMAPVLRTLLMSRHFYDPAIVNNRIKSPVQLVVGTVRMLATPPRDMQRLEGALRTMGQQLFAPPSVAGWDGGRQWINTSTLFARQNTCAYLITGQHNNYRNWTFEKMGYDPMPLIADLPSQTPEAVVDHLLGTLVGDAFIEKRRGPLIEMLNQHGGNVNGDSLVALLLLITALPEYQLC